MMASVTYLGHRIGSDGIHPLPEKVEAIQNAPHPSSVTELKAYLGILTYYSKFLPNMSTVLAPLYELLRQEHQWEWLEEQKAAFQASKELRHHSSSSTSTLSGK